MLRKLLTSVPRLSVLIVAALLGALVAVGCNGTGEPARVAVQVDVDLPDSIARGQPMEVGYTWTPTEDFQPPADDYRVFAHFEDPDGVIALQDDHYPPTPTSQWSPGEEISYRRWIYPPAELEVEHLDVLAGLYTEDGKVPIRHEGKWEVRPRIHRVHVRTEDLSVLPVFVEGWYPEEVADEAGDGGRRSRWHWTQDRAVAVFVNPEGAANLHVELHSPVEEIGGPQTVVFRIGESWSETLEIDQPDPVSRRFEIPASAFGDDDWVQVVVEVDPTFVPAEIDTGSADERTLGAKVFSLLLTPKR